MTRREFDSYFKPMCKALDVNLKSFQADLYFEEFKKSDARDFKHACYELSFPVRKVNWLPEISKFRDHVTAAWEMRREKEKVDGVSENPNPHKIEFTPEERLIANRAAYEVVRQSRACRATGRNCWDKEKVRAASHDPSKDEEIFAKYGRDGEQMPTPAQIFGNIGQGVVDG